MTTLRPGAAVLARPAVGSARSWAGFLMGFLILCGVLFGTSAIDSSGQWGLGILTATLLTAAAIETLRAPRPLRAVLRDLGFGRPVMRALAVAGAVSCLVLLVFPATEAISDTEVRLRQDWLWLLVGIFAFHGLAEELVWRGFTFRRLRRGRSFRSATLWTFPLIAASHLPIVFSLGLAVGIGAMAVSMATSVPFAYLYETGGNTIWAPALVHTAIDTFKLVIIPAAALTTFSVLIIAVSLIVPLLALTVPRRILQPGANKAAEHTTRSPDHVEAT